MKSNFNLIINEISKHINEKEINILKGLINQFELSIYRRNGYYIELDIRYLNDYIWRKLFNDQLNDKLKNLREKLNLKELMFIKSKNIKIKIDFIDKLYENGNLNEEKKLIFEKLCNTSNQKLHYKTGESHIYFNDLLRKLILSLDEMKEIANSFHLLLIWVLENSMINESLKINSPILSEFNKNIYDNSEIFLNENIDFILLKKKYFNKKCYFCKYYNDNGKYIIPDGNFPFGPYLICDKCNSILTPNENLRNETDKKCPTCNEIGLKETYSYKDENITLECTKNKKSCNYKQIL